MRIVEEEMGVYEDEHPGDEQNYDFILYFVDDSGVFFLGHRLDFECLTRNYSIYEQYNPSNMEFLSGGKIYFMVMMRTGNNKRFDMVPIKRDEDVGKFKIFKYHGEDDLYLVPVKFLDFNMANEDHPLHDI